MDVDEDMADVPAVMEEDKAEGAAELLLGGPVGIIEVPGAGAANVTAFLFFRASRKLPVFISAGAELAGTDSGAFIFNVGSVGGV